MVTRPKPGRADEKEDMRKEEEAKQKNTSSATDSAARRGGEGPLAKTRKRDDGDAGRIPRRRGELGTSER
jgi:hypothetical protein